MAVEAAQNKIIHQEFVRQTFISDSVCVSKVGSQGKKEEVPIQLVLVKTKERNFQ